MKPGSSTSVTIDSRTSIITVALCYLIAVFEGFDLQAAGVAAPKLGPAFQMAPAAMGWFFSASTFGLMLGAGFGGRLSDRFGRKSVLIFSVAVFGSMSVLTGLAPNVDSLLLARLFTGVGIGGALPNLVSLVAENSKPSRKNTSVGLLYAGLPSGGALASLTAAVSSAESWQTVFFVGGIAPLIAIPLLMFVLPESHQLTAVKQAQATQGARLRVGYGVALFGDNRAPRTILLWLSFFFALLTMYLLLNWLPTLLVNRGLSRPDASYAQLSFNLLGALASMTTGILMDRMSLSKVVIVSFGAAGVSLWLLSNVTPVFATAVAVAGFVGIAMCATQALLYAVAPSNYPTEVRGTGVGSAVAVGRLGSAAGPLLAAALLGSGKAPQDVLLLLVPIIIAAGLLALVLVGLMRRNSASL
ncbi:MAG: 3-(3-hydroxy-phenyl)propionate transporter MhpT [Steroidobacteraceae bacterium]